jgi:exopolysaccharide biosynthesis predicted pyruvyltransferase EpsI
MCSQYRKKVALLGAFDRFNYGDLLIPIVTKNEIIKHNPQTEVLIHSLVESDLSRFGALKTQSLRTLNKPKKIRPNDIIIFAGGGTIGVDWTYMHSNLLGRSSNLMLYYLSRIFGRITVNELSRLYFGAKSPFPWVASSEDFLESVAVAYNAVGGSEFSKLTFDIQKLTLDRLRKASYLSVRDNETKRLLKSVEDRIEIRLAPDSAVLMSEWFPMSWLECHTNSVLRESLDEAPYVCFQSNINYAVKNEEQILDALKKIYDSFGLRTILLPIGRYVGLDDQSALHYLHKKIKHPALMISDNATIWEIMLVIARSQLFLGTSLHGTITSQSFGIPHLGLSERQCKLDYYLATWDLPDQKYCLEIKEIVDRVDRVLSIPESVRLKKRIELINDSKKNFSRLLSECKLE